MKKTKLLTSVAALALVLSLGACNNGETNETSSENSNTSQSSGGESGTGSESDEIPEGYSKVWYDADAEVITDYNGTTWKQGDLIRGFYQTGSGDAISTDSSIYLESGSIVMVVPFRQYTLDNIEIYANDEKLEQIEDSSLNANLYAYRLEVPSEDCEIIMKASEKLVSITLEENEYVDAYFYLESDPTNQVQTLSNLKVANDKVYLHATIKDSAPSGYIIDTVVASANVYAVPQQYGTSTTKTSWDTDWSSTSTSTSGANFAYVDSDTKFIQIPSWYYTDNQLTISFTTKYQQYADANFVGAWTGLELLSVATYGSQINMNIDGYGNVTGVVESSITSVSDDGTLTLADGRDLLVSSEGKLAAVSWTSLGNLNVSDIYLFAKTSEDVSIELFKIDGQITTNTMKYIAEVFVGGESWGQVYADQSSEKKVYFDITIQFTGSSSSLNDENDPYPTFNVIDANGNILTSITSEEDYHE